MLNTGNRGVHIADGPAVGHCREQALHIHQHILAQDGVSDRLAAEGWAMGAARQGSGGENHTDEGKVTLVLDLHIQSLKRLHAVPEPGSLAVSEHHRYQAATLRHELSSGDSPG